MIERFLLWAFGTMLEDSEHPNTVNDKKAGMLVAGIVMSAHMLTARPADPFLWLVYLGGIGGWNVASYWLKKRLGPGEAK